MVKRARGGQAWSESSRTLVSEARFTGTLLEWKGTFGWIQPQERIDHPEAAKHRGRIYLAQEDVLEDLPGLGSSVSFLAYTDGTLSGVGAAEVRPFDEDEAEPEDERFTSGKARRRGVTVPPPSKGKGTKGKANGKGKGRREVLTAEPLEGTVVEWRGNRGWIEPAYPLDDLLASVGFRGARVVSVFFDLEDAEGVCKAGTPVFFIPYLDAEGVGAMQVTPDRTEQDQTAVFNRVYTTLNDSVWAAVQMTPDIEPQWSTKEFCKRLTRYLYKGTTSLELGSSPWYEAVEKFMIRAMQSYSSACRDRPWFFDLDLSMAFGNAAWVVAQGCYPRPPPPPREEVVHLAAQDYLDRLHRCQLDKVLWPTIQDVFEGDDVVMNKVWNAMSRSYDTALQTAAADSRPVQGFKRAESFVKQWMKDSMTRAWTSVREPESVITEDSVLRLFSTLMAPFGEDDPFSCVPRALVPHEGRPPVYFLGPAVTALFAEWATPPPWKLRKRQSADDALQAESDGADAEESADGAGEDNYEST